VRWSVVCEPTLPPREGESGGVFWGWAGEWIAHRSTHGGRYLAGQRRPSVIKWVMTGVVPEVVVAGCDGCPTPMATLDSLAVLLFLYLLQFTLSFLSLADEVAPASSQVALFGKLVFSPRNCRFPLVRATPRHDVEI
jgi:hypothetical protein